MTKILEHIYYIDDDEDILTISALALESVGGYRVSVFSDGATGIAQAFKDKPDLFLVDMMMPKMDGMDCMKEIQNTKELSHIPVIFVTARVQTSEIKEYESLGAIGVISKPFDPMTLSEDIKTIWSAHNG